MPLRRISISGVLQTHFTPALEGDFDPADIQGTKGAQGVFACDDYQLFLEALKANDPSAYSVVTGLLDRRVNRQGATLTPALIIDCTQQALVVMGGLHDEPYGYDVDGFWLKKTAE